MLKGGGTTSAKGGHGGKVRGGGRHAIKVATWHWQ